MLTEHHDKEATPLIEYVGRIRRRGWCEGTSGNYSVTLARDPLRLLITPSGPDKGSLAARDLLLIDERGRPVDRDAARPSAEALLHVMLARRGAGCVLHTHSVWGTLIGEHCLDRGGFTMRGYEMLKGLHGVDSHDESVFVPVVANSQRMDELAGTVERALDGTPGAVGFVIAGHGLYTWGRDVAEAYRHVEIFEFLFQVLGRRADFAPFEP